MHRSQRAGRKPPQDRLWTCVAMGNACDALKEKATYITDNNVDDGIYHICEKMKWF